MNKRVAILVVACGAAACGAGGVARADSVSLLIDAGLLENAAGTAVVPKGALLQLVASPSGTFADPTSAGYATGDNLVLSSFAMNYNSGTAGETTNAVFSLPVNAAGEGTSGEKVILRFFPGLTYAGMPAAPVAGTSFGQVRSDTIEFGPSGGDGSETKWVLPGAGSTIDLDYITANDGGTYANATADATGVVAAAPEPTSLLLLAGGVAPALLRRRGRPAAR